MSQGSVLAATLFAIRINEIEKLIPQYSKFISSLYVDDLQIGYRHSDLQVIKNFSGVWIELVSGRIKILQILNDQNEGNAFYNATRNVSSL